MKTIQELFQEFSKTVSQVVVGHQAAVQDIFVALLCRGHILLEGVPGIAKTLLAKTVARTLSLQFSRIQFTPDLMPSDIVGTNIFHFETKSFSLMKGPVFTDILLCDEINRTPPKTQSALLEAMEEGQATIDGKSYPLSPSFFVIATQNPLEQEGTYPLPEAQQDRFLMKIHLGHPKTEEMSEILRRFSQVSTTRSSLLSSVQPLLHGENMESYREVIFKIQTDEKIVEYVSAIHAETKNLPTLISAISPRSCLHLLHASRVYAACMGRDFVTPDDIRAVSFSILNHRFLLRAEAEFEGITPKQILSQILERVPVPK